MRQLKYSFVTVFRTSLLFLIFLFLTGCNTPNSSSLQNSSSSQTPQPDQTQIFANVLATANASIQQTILPENTEITTQVAELSETNIQDTGLPAPTPDPNRTPPALPANFTTDLLNKLDTPHTYIADTCEFLKNRWSAGKAEPGTVVMVVMYHSIVQGDESSVTLDNQISSEKNKQIAADLYNQGFTAIDTTQFINFMKYNDYIPPRSVLLIVDDRHHGSYFADHFLPFYQQYGWKVINGWISSDDTTQELWDENAQVEAEGYVDHQAHGVVHNENMTDASSDDFIYNELKGSIDRIQQHFGKIPKAIIWPGGNFGFRPIEIAKELGYEVGFTVSPRGPVMYNWVPLCDETDPARPSYLADGLQDPLFVIPRYWDTDVSQHIDTVRQIGKAAKEQILANRETELEYYDIVCKPKLGELGVQP